MGLISGECQLRKEKKEKILIPFKSVAEIRIGIMDQKGLNALVGNIVMNVY